MKVVSSSNNNNIIINNVPSINISIIYINWKKKEERRRKKSNIKYNKIPYFLT